MPVCVYARVCDVYVCVCVYSIYSTQDRRNRRIGRTESRARYLSLELAYVTVSGTPRTVSFLFGNSSVHRTTGHRLRSRLRFQIVVCGRSTSPKKTFSSRRRRSAPPYAFLYRYTHYRWLVALSALSRASPLVPRGAVHVLSVARVFTDGAQVCAGACRVLPASALIFTTRQLLRKRNAHERGRLIGGHCPRAGTSCFPGCFSLFSIESGLSRTRASTLLTKRCRLGPESRGNGVIPMRRWNLPIPLFPSP